MKFSILKVLHTVGTLNKSSGGPPRSVTGLCEALGECGAKVNIVSQEEGSPIDSSMIPNPRYVQTHTVKYALSNRKWRVYYAPAFKRTVADICEQQGIEIIHDNGVWMPYNYAAATVARRLGIPLVIQPRGCLQPLALDFNLWKKRLAWKLYQKQILDGASLFVATAEQEAESIRKLGLRQPIAVIPNGVNLPPWQDRLPTKKQKRQVLFLSRIHPVKGLLNLVAAWDQLRPKHWMTIVAGRDEGGHLREVQNSVERAGLNQDFKFVGPVGGEAKEKLYRESDLFILPTYTENFGVAVAEALTYGMPVITTTGAPWSGLVTNRCGWWVEPAVKPIAQALQQATSLSDLERYEMGRRGRAFVEQEFSWQKIGKEMLAVYEWMLGFSDRPSCVV
jgi:glycosyltransferase involved in cell wall biosynthesis